MKQKANLGLDYTPSLSQVDLGLKHSHLYEEREN